MMSDPSQYMITNWNRTKRRVPDATIARPAHRWTGSKHDLLDQLRPMRPRSFARYFEPFVGGGGNAYDVLRTFDGPCFLSDANADLVNTYRMIRDHVDPLITVLGRLAERPPCQTAYLDTRHDFNTRPDAHPIDRAAWFIYLMQTCFNGLYRVSRNGFNVPWGKRSHSAVLDTDNLRACSALLRRPNVHIDVADWHRVLDSAEPGDYVYFDPPYQPPPDATGFTKYTAQDFTEADQRELAAAFAYLVRRGVACMLSNSDTPLIRELYSGFDIREVWRSGRMNCKGDGRGRVRELVVIGGYEP
jgi:DNA adenine methylase